MAEAQDGVGNATLELREILDFSACAELCDTVATLQAPRVSIDSGKVKYIGGLAAEILLRAAEQWRSDGVEFVMVNTSKEMREGLTLLGISLDDIKPEGVK